LRNKFEENQGLIEPYKVLFFDETSVNLALDREYGWELKGKPVHDNKPSKRGKSITILGALTVLGLQAVMTIEGGVDEDVFIAYINNVLSKNVSSGDIIILDNFSTHKTAKVKAALEKIGLTILYLPPYSPDLNPVEHAWSKLKSILKSIKARTRDELDAAVAKAIRSISNFDAWGYISHCGYEA
jgi:transposase